MIQPSMTGVGPNTTEARELTDDTEIEHLLGVLEDTDCRSIIEATRAESLSAAELSEQCGLPQSTTYRKLDDLTEVGVLEERIRLSRSGQHSNEYALQVDSIEISVDSDRGVLVRIAGEESTQSASSVAAGAD